MEQKIQYANLDHISKWGNYRVGCPFSSDISAQQLRAAGAGRTQRLDKELPQATSDSWAFVFHAPAIIGW